MGEHDSHTIVNFAMESYEMEEIQMHRPQMLEIKC